MQNRHHDLLSGLLIVLALPMAAWAAQHQVPEDFKTIQEAIDQAGRGDIVSIAPGRYRETIDLKGKAIVLKGRGDSPTILDGTDLKGSVVRCVSGEGPLTRLDGLVLISGSGDQGEYGDKATVGGGLLLVGASPTISKCQFQGNVVTYNGGAVYARNSNSQFTACGFTGNTAEKGGGVYASRSTLSFTSCTFEQNNAIFGGGAVFSDNRSDTTIVQGMFSENRASFNGGALYDYDSATTVTDSIFLNNMGAYKGGAAYHGWRSRGRFGEGNEFRTPNDDIAGSARSLNQADPLGACFVSGSCILTRQSACQEAAGTWAGPDTRCDETDAPDTGKQGPKGDLNADGRVDVLDMAILMGTWGRRGE